ncbi:Crp/Fnr family transcriptional regulator [Marixanthomonas spongiae]|uniref:Crp/Fnr family transcriptional regulator n=1 Tax=Marixanthomonas spongiae TaxID=2174845 RepID=A0A2U0HVF4_9FLAO|nr:Crp/Fnr family transcriptional regulator [Marixanthomonas spongiae]PVW12828.1 Crp/Fnr family transcriptional regulator [Marixanthomonas spongiae]
MIQELKTYYGGQFEPELIEEIDNVGTFMEVPEGQDLMRPGQYIKSMPLLLLGSIKILRPDDEGEQLLLYHLERGDTCAMTMTCCMGDKKSEIHAVTETPVKLLMIPIGKMEEWSRKYKTWRNFVFSNYHNRMMEMLESIDNIAFNNMDERLENYLQNRIEILNSKHIYTTHKQIASDLHTSRVVISRLLKKMENNKKIKLHRSFIEVL